jgi:hypothetical protein
MQTSLCGWPPLQLASRRASRREPGPETAQAAACLAIMQCPGRRGAMPAFLLGMGKGGGGRKGRQWPAIREVARLHRPRRRSARKLTFCGAGAGRSTGLILIAGGPGAQPRDERIIMGILPLLLAFMLSSGVSGKASI